MANNRLRDEGGAALIEAALILPILLTLILGLAEISIYFWNWGLANKAAQLGARRAVVSDAVAVGPGLDPGQSEAYWDGLRPGERCLPEANGRSACPRFSVVCDVASGCRCSGDACGFTFAPARLVPILAVMRSVLPDLRPEDLRITYATNGLGYVDRPVPVPVDVTVALVGLKYETLFMRSLFGPTLPLRASSQLPSEALRSP